jgi:mercuric ion transport protein
MKDNLLALGLWGSAFAALCCVTPLLPWLFAAIGITGFLGYINNDGVLFGALAAFLLLTSYAEKLVTVRGKEGGVSVAV